MSTITTNQDSIAFLTKKVNALYKRAEFLTSIMDDLYESGNVLTERQKQIAVEYVPFIPKKNATNVEPLPNSVPNNYRDNSSDPLTFKGETVYPTKQDLKGILPDIIHAPTTKYFTSMLNWGSLSQKQYDILLRIWGEIVDKGWYLRKS
tara:strand:+ start:581 stop:1027 length:447 start_codon:yes stop_codon:yes gene_type:complete